MTEMQERIDAAVVDWAMRIPLDQIPYVLVFLAGRLLAEGTAGNHRERNGSSATVPVKLLTAGEIAERLSLPESWIRAEERAGRIPGIRAGKYVRFKLSDVEQVLAERKR
jgi:excisionase family DNA binding protein